MWLVVGLGNPGPRYERNRHNIGFRIVDELAKRHRIVAFRDKFGGLVATGTIDGTRVVLLKPMEFMNLSGHAVQRAAAFHKVEPASVAVIHDDIDFSFGRMKVKSEGGHGGHNGLRSIIAQLGSNEFLRLRIGVGRPAGEHGPDVSDYVLSDFPATLDSDVEQLTMRAADAVDMLVRDGTSNAMNQINRQPKKDGDE